MAHKKHLELPSYKERPAYMKGWRVARDTKLVRLGLNCPKAHHHYWTNGRCIHCDLERSKFDRAVAAARRAPRKVLVPRPATEEKHTCLCGETAVLRRSGSWGCARCLEIESRIDTYHKTGGGGGGLTPYAVHCPI